VINYLHRQHLGFAEIPPKELSSVTDEIWENMETDFYGSSATIGALA
jgi:hypothetical protein